MTLTAKDVAEITRLLDESNFDELYLECDGLKLSLKRNGAGADAPLERVAAVPSSPAPAEFVAPAKPAPQPSAAVDPSVHEVRAPLLGTFYRAPKPGAPAFVEVGARVDEDTIVGIIEVMKLMNTVRAAVRGTVVAIQVADGGLVEYGQALLHVRRDTES